MINFTFVPGLILVNHPALFPLSILRPSQFPSSSYGVYLLALFPLSVSAWLVHGRLCCFFNRIASLDRTRFKGKRKQDLFWFGFSFISSTSRNIFADYLTFLPVNVFFYIYIYKFPLYPDSNSSGGRLNLTGLRIIGEGWIWRWVGDRLVETKQIHSAQEGKRGTMMIPIIRLKKRIFVFIHLPFLGIPTTTATVSPMRPNTISRGLITIILMRPPLSFAVRPPARALCFILRKLGEPPGPTARVLFTIVSISLHLHINNPSYSAKSSSLANVRQRPC